MSPFKRDHKMVSPPWCSFLEKFGDHVLVAVTTVRLSVDCICSGRIVLFAPVEHPVFVPITFFQLSHPDISSNRDISSNLLVSCFKALRLIAATCQPERGIQHNLVQKEMK